MKSKIIVFDMDGVLFDSTIVVMEYMKSLFPTLTIDVHKEILVGNFHEEIAKLNISRKKETEEEESYRKLKYSKEKSTVPMYEGAKDLLVDLKNQGYILVLNTSAFDRNCLPLLENSNTKDLFDFLATAELSKSKSEKFKIIQGKYNVQQDEMLFITDTLGDIREADIAGIPTVAVTYGAHDRSYFIREEHKNLLTILDSIEELRSFLFN